MVQCSILRTYCYYDLRAQDENFSTGVRNFSLRELLIFFKGNYPGHLCLVRSFYVRGWEQVGVRHFLFQFAVLYLERFVIQGRKGKLNEREREGRLRKRDTTNLRTKNDECVQQYLIVARENKTRLISVQFILQFTALTQNIVVLCNTFVISVLKIITHIRQLIL